ncbi:hypothetical protein CC79DRAFT_1362991 [Sarocladium strictum]
MGLRAEYSRSTFFDEDKLLRLATAATARGRRFADQMATFGHEIEFDEAPEADDIDWDCSQAKSALSHVSTRQVEAHPDIEDVLPEPSDVFQPKARGITTWLKDVYNDHKGFELGKLPSSLLSTTMRRQASRWELLASCYVGDMATMVYRFVVELIEFTVLGNRKVCDAVKSLCLDSLREKYESAMRHTAFLLEQELQGVPATYSKRFEAGLAERRAKRSQVEAAEKSAQYSDPHSRSNLTEILALSSAVSSDDRRVQDIQDISRSYYEVALDRFVDNMRMQVVDNCLVTGNGSPLTFFSPAFVAGLTKEQLEEVAGEDKNMMRRRAELEREMQRLEEGKKTLR